jgi:DNA-binding Lrp family transcriptional regulator
MTNRQNSSKSGEGDSKLTDVEKKIIALIQADIPVTERPFLEIAKQVGVEEDVVLKTLRKFHGDGTIRRFGVTIRHQISGYKANAMVAWQVDEDRIDDVGKLMAAFEGVTHCYRRNPAPKMAEAMSTLTSVTNYSLLFSREELKKTSMKYFQ